MDNMKFVILSVISGVVALAIFRTTQAQPSGQIGGVIAPQLGINAGIAPGVPSFFSLPVPSGHGDATQNAYGGGPLSTVDGTYAPMFGPTENRGTGGGGSSYYGVYLQ